jgi:hypothetical protein
MTKSDFPIPNARSYDRVARLLWAEIGISQVPKSTFANMPEVEEPGEPRKVSLSDFPKCCLPTTRKVVDVHNFHSFEAILFTATVRPARSTPTSFDESVTLPDMMGRSLLFARL